ncbi:MAG TPA: hypothetical protein VK980_17220 [Sphingomonas sp.]|nr:hypothetical protein [Sphingomonas sp.]
MLRAEQVRAKAAGCRTRIDLIHLLAGAAHDAVDHRALSVRCWENGDFGGA